jgi:hypothetical protein
VNPTMTIAGAACAAIALMGLAGAPLGPVILGTVVATGWLLWRARAKRS